MKRGTKSLLFGAHCWLIHPWFVALAWWRLYHWQVVECPSSHLRVSLKDPRLWLCFIVHDWGYWQSPDMDGRRGELHPGLAARLMDRLLWPKRYAPLDSHIKVEGGPVEISYRDQRGMPWPQVTSIVSGGWARAYGQWGWFCLFHSRFLAKSAGVKPSALCMADKLSIALTPAWLYVPMARLSGEIKEYRSRDTRPERSKNWSDSKDRDGNDYEWFRRVQEWVRDYVAEHRDGRDDEWTAQVARVGR